MNSRTQLIAVLSLLAFFGVPNICRPVEAAKESAKPKPAKWSEPAKDLYSPNEEDFRPIYDADTAVQKVQTWRDYWSWVNQFYKGNFLSSGWTKQCGRALAVVKAEATRDELRGMLNVVGRRIAGEWSKDNNLRKIDTADLQSIGRRFQDAAAKDDGSGKVLRALIEKIRGEVEQRLK
jgi:hypothetical protein